MAAKRRSREATPGSREGSDAERCRQWALQSGRRASSTRDRARDSRRRHELELRHRENQARLRERRTSPVLFHEDGESQYRVPARVACREAGRAAEAVVVATVLGRDLRIAPRLAEQRGARPSGEHQHDGQDGCAEHDQLSPAAKARTTPDRQDRILARNPV